MTTDVLYPELEIALDWTGSAKSITSLVLSFNDPLVAANADNPANYALVNVGRDGIFGTRDDRTVEPAEPGVQHVELDSDADTSQSAAGEPILPPLCQRHVSERARRLGRRASYRARSRAAWDELHGHAGPRHQPAVLRRRERQGHTDPEEGRVSERHVVELKRAGARLIVVGEHPRRTVLTGKLVKAKHGAGLPILGYTIYGLGEFGDVQVNMKDPPFVVTRYPFSPGSPIPQPPPVETRVARPVVPQLVAFKKPRMSKRDAPH